MKNGDEEIYYKPEDRGIYLSVNGCGYLVVEIGQGCVCKKDLSEVGSVKVMTEKGWLVADFQPRSLPPRLVYRGVFVSICYSCERESDVETVQTTRTTEIRGVTVSHDEHYYECPLCGDRSWGPELPDPLKLAFDAYEKLTRLPYKLRFKATDEQIRQVLANAVNASTDGNSATEELFLPAAFDFGSHIDFYRGRKVKLRIHPEGDGVWSVYSVAPRPEYQTWCHQYPTYKALMESVPGVVLV